MVWPMRHDSPKKCALFEDGKDGLLALTRDHAEPDLAFLDEKHGICCIALREDRVVLWKFQIRLAVSDFREERLGIERLGTGGGWH